MNAESSDWIIWLYFCIFCQVKDKYGISPLLAAIYEGHTEAVKMLLKQVVMLLFAFIDFLIGYVN